MYRLTWQTSWLTPPGNENLTAHLCCNCAGIYKNGEDLSNSENDKRVKKVIEADRIKQGKIIEKYLKDNPNAPDYETWELEAQVIREEYNLPKEQPEQQREREREQNYSIAKWDTAVRTNI